MRTMGLDVGTKTIGVAVSDEMGWTAQGVETIRRNDKDPESDFHRLDQLVNDYDIDSFVVGLPKNMNGSIGPSGQACQAFAERLRERYNERPVQMWDERLTTVSAERLLIESDVSRKKRKKVIDKMAAVFILQNYLDSQSK